MLLAASTAVAPTAFPFVPFVPFVAVAGLDTVLQLHIPPATLGIPLWSVQSTHAPSWTVAALLVVSTMPIGFGSSWGISLNRARTRLGNKKRGVRIAQHDRSAELTSPLSSAAPGA
jgi:hypothetical protein